MPQQRRWLMLAIAVCSAALAPAAFAAAAKAPAVPTPTPLPGHSQEYLPLLNKLIDEMWPELPLRSMLAAQIEQETCISLKSKGCWNPHTELKTDREYGFGLGQITIVYNADGSVKASTFDEVKKLGKGLADWKFEDRYDPEMQLRALILMEKNEYAKIKFDTADDTEKLAFMLSAYNGGLGGVLQDRKLCEAPGCDASKWFGHVALNSKKAKKPIAGYSTSFYDTNRCYPRFILLPRRNKYAPHLHGKLDPLVDPTQKMPNVIDGTACAGLLPATGLGQTPVDAAAEIAPAIPAGTVVAMASVAPSTTAVASATVAASSTVTATATKAATATATPTKAPVTATPKATATATPAVTATKAAPVATPTAAAGSGTWTADLKICTKLENRECTDAGDSFKAGDTVIAWSKVTASPGEGEIHHVWYHGDVKTNDITLKVPSTPYRTNSKREMSTSNGTKGDWRVEIKAGSETIATAKFTIK